jgi:hypothetical protein
LKGHNCLRKKAVTIRHTVYGIHYLFVWKYSEITGGLLTIAVILYYERLSVSAREYLKRMSHETDLASDDIYGYHCSLIKVDWLDAGVALRVVGAVLFSSGVGVKFAQSSSQWEARADTRRNVPNLADPIRTRETWTKYTPLALLSQRKLALTARNTLFFNLKNLKMAPSVPYLGL